MAGQVGISTFMTQNGFADWSGDDDGGGKAGFKTSIWIEDSEGNDLKTSQTKPMPVWEMIPDNAKLKYRVETLSDKKGKSDKFQFDIHYQNAPAIGQELRVIEQNLTEEQKEAYLAGSPQMEDTVAKMLEQRMIDKSIPLTLAIYSKQITTNDDGVAEGEIDISEWPLADYTIMLHYGYQHDAESRTNWGNAWKNIGVGVVMTALLVGSFFVPFIGLASAAIITAEVALAIALEMAKQYAPATYNKYGAEFPVIGFIHPYAFGRYGDTYEEQVQQGTTIGGVTIPTADTEKMAGIIGGIFLLFLIIRGRR